MSRSQLLTTEIDCITWSKQGGVPMANANTELPGDFDRTQSGQDDDPHACKVKNTFLEFSIPSDGEGPVGKRRSCSDMGGHLDPRSSPLVLASKSPIISPALGPSDEPRQAVPIDEVSFELLEGSTFDTSAFEGSRHGDVTGVPGEMVAQAHGGLSREDPAYVIPTTPSPFLHSAFPPAAPPPLSSYGEYGNFDMGLPPAYADNCDVGPGMAGDGFADGYDSFTLGDSGRDRQFMQPPGGPGAFLQPDVYEGAGAGFGRGSAPGGHHGGGYAWAPPPGPWTNQEPFQNPPTARRSFKDLLSEDHAASPGPGGPHAAGPFHARDAAQAHFRLREDDGLRDGANQAHRSQFQQRSERDFPGNGSRNSLQDHWLGREDPKAFLHHTGPGPSHDLGAGPGFLANPRFLQDPEVLDMGHPAGFSGACAGGQDARLPKDGRRGGRGRGRGDAREPPREGPPLSREALILEQQAAAMEAQRRGTPSPTGHMTHQTVSAGASEEGTEGEPPAGSYTTVMLRNIPNKYTREMLVKQLNLEFHGQIDFMYLPIDFKNKCNVGYGFLNFRTPIACEAFISKFHGVDVRKCLPGLNSKKIVEVTPARVQGLSENVRRLRNSPVMNQLQDHPEWMPLLFNKHGQEEPFPMPDVPLPPVKPRGRNREAMRSSDI